MKYCANCGEGVNEGDSYCSNCGAEVGVNGSETLDDTAEEVLRLIEKIVDAQIENLGESWAEILVQEDLTPRSVEDQIRPFKLYVLGHTKGQVRATFAFLEDDYWEKTEPGILI